MKSRMVVHFRPTLAEFAFVFAQIVLPRDAEIVPGTKIAPARHDRASVPFFGREGSIEKSTSRQPGLQRWQQVGRFPHKVHDGACPSPPAAPSVTVGKIAGKSSAMLLLRRFSMQKGKR